MWQPREAPATAPAPTTAKAPAPELIALHLISGESCVGELLSDQDGDLHILELKTGKERIAPNASIRKITRNLSDADAVGLSDIPTVVTWKVSKLAARPVLIAHIAKAADNIVYIAAGSAEGIVQGQRLEVFRDEGEIIDPTSGKVLGRDRARIGQVEVFEVLETYSKARPWGSKVVPQRGDQVQMIPQRAAIAVLPLVDAKGSEPAAGSALAKELHAAISARQLPIVDRGVLDGAINMLTAQREMLFEPRLAQRLGRQLGVSAVLAGRIAPDGTIAHFRLVSAETGQIILVAARSLPPAPATAAASAPTSKPVTTSAAATTSTPPAPPPAPPTSRLIQAIEPPDESFIAEDVHRGLAANHPSFTRDTLYAVKIDAKQPLVKVAQTSICFQGFRDPGTITNGAIRLSTDYGKTWVRICDWNTPLVKEGSGAWLCADLAPLFAKEPGKELDELQVRFDCNQQSLGLYIDKVQWVNSAALAVAMVRPPATSPARAIEATEPPDEKVIAEDIHPGISANHP